MRGVEVTEDERRKGMSVGPSRWENGIGKIDVAMDVGLVLLMEQSLVLINGNLSWSLCGSYFFEDSPPLVIRLIASVEGIDDIQFMSAWWNTPLTCHGHKSIRASGKIVKAELISAVSLSIWIILGRIWDSSRTWRKNAVSAFVRWKTTLNYVIFKQEMVCSLQLRRSPASSPICSKTQVHQFRHRGQYKCKAQDCRCWYRLVHNIDRHTCPFRHQTKVRLHVASNDISSTWISRSLILSRMWWRPKPIAMIPSISDISR